MLLRRLGLSGGAECVGQLGNIVWLRPAGVSIPEFRPPRAYGPQRDGGLLREGAAFGRGWLASPHVRLVQPPAARSSVNKRLSFRAKRGIPIFTVRPFVLSAGPPHFVRRSALTEVSS